MIKRLARAEEKLTQSESANLEQFCRALGQVATGKKRLADPKELADYVPYGGTDAKGGPCKYNSVKRARIEASPKRPDDEKPEWRAMRSDLLGGW